MPPGCELYQGTEDWGESDVAEIVDKLERVHADRVAWRTFSEETQSPKLIARHSWQEHAIPALLAAVEPETPGEEAAA